MPCYGYKIPMYHFGSLCVVVHVLVSFLLCCSMEEVNMDELYIRLICVTIKEEKKQQIKDCHMRRDAMLKELGGAVD